MSDFPQTPDPHSPIPRRSAGMMWIIPISFFLAAAFGLKRGYFHKAADINSLIDVSATIQRVEEKNNRKLYGPQIYYNIFVDEFPEKLRLPSRFYDHLNADAMSALVRAGEKIRFRIREKKKLKVIYGLAAERTELLSVYDALDVEKSDRRFALNLGILTLLGGIFGLVFCLRYARNSA